MGQYLRDNVNKGSIINNDNSALESYKRQRENARLIKKNEQEVANELKEIKLMLKQILEKLS